MNRRIGSAFSALESYNKTIGKTLKTADSWLDNADYVLIGGVGIAKTAEFASRIAGREAPGAGNVAEKLSQGRSAISFSRLAFTIEKFLSLRFLFSTKADGSWETATEEDIARGDPAIGGYKIRDWKMIALDVCLLIGRVFSFLGNLSRLKVIELGKHAKWIGIVVICAFTAVTTLSTIKAFVDPDRDPARVKVANAVYEFFYFLSMPWENGLGFESNKYLALAGGILFTCTGLAFLAKTLVAQTAPPRVG